MNANFQGPTLRAAERDWLRLRKQFQSSFRSPTAAETGAIGVLGVNNAGPNGRPEYLLADVFWPGPGDLKVAHNQALVFDASYVRRAHLFMRQKGLAGLAMFHTHPLSDEDVHFSRYDDQQEPMLLANLREMEPATLLVSVVAGKRSQCGRVWAAGDSATPRPLGRLATVGETLQYLSLAGTPAAPPPVPAAAFDRGQAVTGRGALALLAGMTVAVVGASGTGSLVCEFLARAGCRRLILVDDDVCKVVNLNRVLYVTADDVERRRPKVDVLKRGIESLGLGCGVEAVVGNVLDRDVLAALRRADVVFGCVDRALPRQILCEFAYRYHRPYIDVGTEIGGDARGAVAALNARTSYVAPGRPCLGCTGLVTPRALGFESQSWAERGRVVRQGYSDDLIMDQPAVMDLNARASSYGVMVLRHLLQPFLLTPLPAAISENLVTYTTLAVREARAANDSCPTCRQNANAGWGDCGPTVGLDREAVAAIVGPATAD